MHFPRRIICLSGEATDILIRIGAGDRLVGVSAFAHLPEPWNHIPRVSGFESANLERIRQLEPDLIIAYSDVQATLVGDFVRDGFTVLATNQRSLMEIAETIEMIGRVVGAPEAGRELAEDFRVRIQPVKADRARPKVYFEEWPEPMVSGICWVSELIEAAGGEDIFPEFRRTKKAEQRVVSSEEIIRRNPDIMVASWCGKKADLGTIRSRPGWEAIGAVQRGQVYEMDSSIILQPGPVLMEGLDELRRIIESLRTA